MNSLKQDAPTAAYTLNLFSCELGLEAQLILTEARLVTGLFPHPCSCFDYQSISSSLAFPQSGSG